MATKKRPRAKRRPSAAPPPLTPAEQRYLEAFGDLVEELQRDPAELKKPVAERKTTPTVRDVSERLGFSVMAAQGPLRKLEEKGYLKNKWGWGVIGKELAPEGEKWLAYRRGTS